VLQQSKDYPAATLLRAIFSVDDEPQDASQSGRRTKRETTTLAR
jgi:hypothetical protein